MAFPYVPYDWNPGDVLTEARMDNLESQFQSVLDLLTTRGDLPYRGAATWERLAAGAQGTILEMGANDPFWGTSPARLTVAETEVFNGVSPGAWTDLDLSGTIGGGSAIVLLKSTETGNAGSEEIFVRKNGDTDEFFAPGNPYSTNSALVGQNSTYHGSVIVATDSAGIIEWRTRNNRTVTVDVIAYIK